MHVQRNALERSVLRHEVWLASFDMSNQTELGEKTVDEHRAAFTRSSKLGHLNLLVRS